MWPTLGVARNWSPLAPSSSGFNPQAHGTSAAPILMLEFSKGEIQNSLPPYANALLHRMKLSAGATKAAQRHPKPTIGRKEILKPPPKKNPSVTSKSSIFWFHSYTMALLKPVFHRESAEKKGNIHSRFRLSGAGPRSRCSPCVCHHPCSPDSIILQCNLFPAMDPTLCCYLVYYSHACIFSCTEIHTTKKDLRLGRKEALSEYIFLKPLDWKRAHL